MDRDYSNTLITSHTATSYIPVDVGITSWHQSAGRSVIGGGNSGDSESNAIFGLILAPGPHQTQNALVVLAGNPNQYIGVGSFPSTAAFVPFLYTRTDGFDVAAGASTLTIQGVRAQDNATGKWTTPDAYAGDVHDPMSQKSFMWNNNNPYMYSDPSGFMTVPKCVSVPSSCAVKTPGWVKEAVKAIPEVAVMIFLTVVAHAPEAAENRAASVAEETSATAKLGDLTAKEVTQIQNVVNKAGRPLHVVGSAARGTRKPGSDIDYVASPGNISNYHGLEFQLPGNTTTTIQMGVPDATQGPSIPFNPTTFPR